MFIKGRQITDNIIIAHKLLRFMKTNNNYMEIKLDMSKAYDRVKWNFLIKMMEKWDLATKDKMDQRMCDVSII